MTDSSWRARFLAAIPYGSSTGTKAPTLLPDEPEVIVRGSGCRVSDDRGREFIDYRNALGPVTLGYRYPAVDEAIRAQLDDGIVFGQPHPLECEVAELFCALVPGAEQARFLKTGGEAIAATIRIARAYTGRDHVVQIGYNGWLNSLAVGALARPGLLADRPAGVPTAVSELHHQIAWNDRQAVDELFATLDGKIAALVVAGYYPELAAGGEFYPYLRELTDRHGTLLVFDEIVTGFRLAIGGVAEHFGVTPDLSVYAKGIANGMPLSVYTGRRDVLETVASGRVVVSSTLGGETLSLAAALATLRVYQDNDVIGHLWRVGEQLWSGVGDLIDKHGLPLQVRGLAPCPALLADPDRPDALATFLRLAYRHGVSLNTVSYVNLSHSEADVAETLDRLSRAVDSFPAA